MSKRRLPLDSPDWTPFDVLHPLVCAQTGDRHFADRDLTDAMANGRVRSMRRRISPRADKPERELLLPSFWADYKLDSSWSDISACAGEQWLLVVERDPPPPPWRLEPVPPEWNRGPLPLLRLETGLQKNFWSACRAGGHKGVSARKARKTRASPDYSAARTARGNRASLLAKGTVYCTGKPYDTDHGIAGMAQKKVQKRT
jgi:hypothetical protein